MLIISETIQIPLSELQFTFVRSSGPGGQNVNKVASKAVLRWDPKIGGLLDETVLVRLARLYPTQYTKEGEIVLASQRTRDALKNKEDCLQKLRIMLQNALKEPKRRIPTRPTKGSVRRRLEDKARNSQKKQERGRIDE